MNRLGAIFVLVVFAFVAGASPIAPAEAQRRSLSMLDRLSDGRWELRMRGGREVQRICLRDGSILIQLRHPQQACERIVVTDSADEVAVQYTCRGRGYGLTHIRRETDSLIQIESQGVADRLPFDFAAEGRRVGDCAT